MLAANIEIGVFAKDDKLSFCDLINSNLSNRNLNYIKIWLGIKISQISILTEINEY